ncbi:type II toxin-antitoxin system RelE/ParE family toxin [Desulfomonile tiedjei]|uniref:Plasmid maintenance system killer protein n=1 Tax=Desulfomonile tiedjei (strain ATCC 49306 / DSM 6799 / DCB-1) TaxID=706587 RepID=I4C5M2_DESTA|nr:type II toxin-antitoxin system RelE/ParE family toxin [Desulfomonile tiedjei]AFM24863.1 plasmid maintenance system killer protein [Desulfomonile tiedjei DSM 6799]
MDIDFKSKKLMKIFNSEERLRKEYGPEQARLIQRRMWILRAAPTLADVPTDKPERRHQLKGDRKNQFAVDLKQPFRLIFEPNHNPIPRSEDGNIITSNVTAITILEVKDYH